MVINPPTPIRGSMGHTSWGFGEWSNVTLRSQVMYEELSAGEHALGPGAVLPPHAF